MTYKELDHNYLSRSKAAQILAEMNEWRRAGKCCPAPRSQVEFTRAIDKAIEVLTNNIKIQ